MSKILSANKIELSHHKQGALFLYYFTIHCFFKDKLLLHFMPVKMKNSEHVSFQNQFLDLKPKDCQSLCHLLAAQSLKYSSPEKHPLLM